MRGRHDKDADWHAKWKDDEPECGPTDIRTVNNRRLVIPIEKLTPAKLAQYRKIARYTPRFRTRLDAIETEILSRKQNSDHVRRYRSALLSLRRVPGIQKTDE